MADNDQSKIRYDDFISSVQPDPAKPESTIMLSGFIGHGPDGHARVYPDPTLGTWYDIPEGDILHSLPIADSKLGGSYVWVRASSEIKPGSAAPPAPQAEAEAARPQQAAAAGMNPTPRTHCFVCDPPKAAAPAAAGGALQNTHLECTQILCTQGLATFCGCTPGIDCMAPPGNVQTHAPICTQGFPTFCGCTPGIDCMGLAARGAPQQANAATGVTVCFTDCQPPVNAMMRAAVAMNPTPRTHCHVCNPPMAAAAMQPTPTVQTHCFICPPHTQNCTPATVCTHAVHCPTQPVVCDTFIAPTPATRCFICPPPNQNATFATVCTLPPACPQPGFTLFCGVIPPSMQGCQQGGAQPQLEAMQAARAPTPPTNAVCTNEAFCPSRFVCATDGCTDVCVRPAQALGAPAAMTLGCPPHNTVHNSVCICPTPSAVHQCGGQTFTPQTFTPTIPQFTLFGGCPTFGVCPSVACTFTPVQNGVFTPFGR